MVYTLILYKNQNVISRKTMDGWMDGWNLISQKTTRPNETQQTKSMDGWMDGWNLIRRKTKSSNETQQKIHWPPEKKTMFIK